MGPKILEIWDTLNWVGQFYKAPLLSEVVAAAFNFKSHDVKNIEGFQVTHTNIYRGRKGQTGYRIENVELLQSCKYAVTLPEV